MKKYILIEYLPNYRVKYCFSKVAIKESEGNGWYLTVGKKLRCTASLVKDNHSSKGIIVTEDKLSESELKEFLREKYNYENSQIHKSRIQSFTQLTINKHKNCWL